MLNIVIAIFLSILLVVVAIKLYLEWNFQYWKKRNVRGPKPKAFVGTFPKTRGRIINLIEELHEIYMQYKSTERFVGIFLGRHPKLFVLDPVLAVQILTQHFKSFRDNESSLWTSPRVEQMRLQSPFVATGEEWRQKRSELVPAITSNKLKSFHSNMEQSAAKMLQYIKSNQHKSIDGWELAQRFTADSMINFIWGLEEQSFDADISLIHQMANEMMDQAGRCVNYYSKTAAVPWLRRIRPERFFPLHTDNFFKQLAMDALNARKQNENFDRADVINHLVQLQEKKSLSDTEIAGHTTSLVVDGYATTAVLLAQTLLLLARNPRTQIKLREELNEPSKMNFDEINELPYLDQCVQEALRIFPPLPTLFKICTERITLKNNKGSDVTLEPNDYVYISAYSFHHDPDFFENPEEYWPERFDAQFGGIKKFEDMGVFLPFGDGPRKCPGLKLGLYETKMALAAIIKNFEVSITGKTRSDNKIAPIPFLFTVAGDITLIFNTVKAK